MISPLWTGPEALEAMAARAVGEPPSRIDGVSIDTRTLRPGDLFVALRGEARDGHDFVHAAFEKGAAAALVAADRAEDLAGAGPLFVVEDTLHAMEALGRAARERSVARIIAITGSVGKTGSKEAMRLLLSREGLTHASVASYNNHWGVPLTLARMPREARFGVFEIGMNHSGEIAPLTRMVRPHVAIVTTVEAVHIEHFRSVSGIADAKGEIFLGLEPGGAAVLNSDNPHFERLKAHALASNAGRVVSFGEGEGADVRAERIILRQDMTIVDARVFGESLTYRIGMIGRHVAINSLGLIAAVKALGLDLAVAALALGDMTPPTGRGARESLAYGAGSITLVDETYNANPASVRAALETLGQTEIGFRGRRVAVLGDMLELGDDGPRLHAELAASVMANGVDLVFGAGPLMKNLISALPPERRGGYAKAADALEPAVVSALRPGDVVMVKGSRGVRMETVIAAVRRRASVSRGRQEG
ncbi:MAG: UDP-N-acetylmuramoylalanyl-D-glutamyl-2,6-diaminopimelate--D-alanyl-D-alanine ligase [Salinarimonadaceae bacterium]|nr:MAG: UDP-N-acetylmuramoylalanyl-D-glutamyl-2,6-diaminopimelate--D-alanyl-D-alanine ligase [Salinarimonadaceae bacterium]